MPVRVVALLFAATVTFWAERPAALREENFDRTCQLEGVNNCSTHFAPNGQLDFGYSP